MTVCLEFAQAHATAAYLCPSWQGRLLGLSWLPVIIDFGGVAGRYKHRGLRLQLPYTARIQLTGLASLKLALKALFWHDPHLVAWL